MNHKGGQSPNNPTEAVFTVEIRFPMQGGLGEPRLLAINLEGALQQAIEQEGMPVIRGSALAPSATVHLCLLRCWCKMAPHLDPLVNQLVPDKPPQPLHIPLLLRYRYRARCSRWFWINGSTACTCYHC
jgi:hypothetical protein